MPDGQYRKRPDSGHIAGVLEPAAPSSRPIHLKKIKLNAQTETKPDKFYSILGYTRSSERNFNLKT
jgi:hypothetical protein